MVMHNCGTLRLIPRERAAITKPLSYEPADPVRDSPGSSLGSNGIAFTNSPLSSCGNPRQWSGPLSGTVEQWRLRHVADEHVASAEFGFDQIVGQ
jgi:hypothetical protein